MSRSDLDKIQARLKVAIQSHQLLVSKMKSDPQNAVVQKQLHDLQSQITMLSEKQKSIVQMLRKELVHKPSSSGQTTPKQTTNCPVSTPPVSVHIKSLTTLQTIPQTTIIQNTAPKTLPTKTLPTIAPKPTTPNNHHVDSPVCKNINNQQQLQQAKSASDMLLQNKIVVNNNNKTIKFGNILADKNSPSIRIPQFHTNRPSILQGGSRQVLGKTSVSSLVPVSARRGSETDLTYLRKASLCHDAATPEEKKKLEFMASLDLITPNTLKELQNRRSERKRRSTANPQFSYGHLEPERKRATTTYLTQVPVQPGAKRRGRPPKNRSPVVQTPPIMSPSLTKGKDGFHGNSFPSSNQPLSQIDAQITSSFPTSDIHEDYCAVCIRSGELLMCDTCNLVYHLGCLDPPLSTIPQGLWSCPKCHAVNKQSGTNWSGTMALVHSYITHKAAKEEEKQKLNKQSQELKKEKSQLEIKTKKLNESIAHQVQLKAELALSHRTAQQSVDQLKNLINIFQSSS